MIHQRTETESPPPESAAAERPARKSVPRDYFEALLIAVILLNFTRIFVFQFFRIPSGSMMDNLLVGDHIVVNKFAYGAAGEQVFGRLPFAEIRRLDIVVFRYPDDPSTDFVKRVIGLPGETIAIRSKTVWIDGRRLDEPYTRFEDPRVYPASAQLPEPYRSRDQFGPVRLPQGGYFVMGDNRDRSNDSRYWGPVPRAMIKGKAFMVYWSYEGKPALPGSSPIERLKELADVAGHFFTRTRWDRTFSVIDSRYHYGGGAETGDQKRP